MLEGFKTYEKNNFRGVGYEYDTPVLTIGKSSIGFNRNLIDLLKEKMLGDNKRIQFAFNKDTNELFIYFIPEKTKGFKIPNKKTSKPFHSVYMQSIAIYKCFGIKIEKSKQYMVDWNDNLNGITVCLEGKETPWREALK